MSYCLPEEKDQGPEKKKNLKSSSDLKHGKDNGYQGD